MIKLTPAIRLSLGLVFLTISILIVAQGLGLTPGQKEGIIAGRQQLAENIALQTTLALKQNEELLLRAYFNQSVKLHPAMQSIALRKLDKSLIYATPDHEAYWGDYAADLSTPTHLKIPLQFGGVKKAILEISFAPLSEESNLWLGIPHFIWLIIFVCLSGFIAFLIYIKRVLQHLDPSSVVPTRVRNALNVMAEGVLILDKREQIVLVNEALSAKLGIPESAMIGRRASDLGWRREGKHSSAAMPWFIAQETNQKQVGARLSLYAANRYLVFRVNAVPIKDGKGKSLGIIASFDDVTELEEKSQLLEQMIKDLTEKQKDIEHKNKELNYLASRDPLTNCYNRRSLFTHLDSYFKKRGPEDNEYSLIMADIDLFKNINDCHGHSTGDEVIRGLAETLLFNIRPGDIVARFGGEEFCILLPHTSPERAYAIAEMCRKKIESKTISGLKITSSFGVSSVLYGATTSNELISQADEALYESKREGRNRTTLWDPKFQKVAQS